MTPKRDMPNPPSKSEVKQKEGIFAGLNRDAFDHSDPAKYMEKFKKGISPQLVAAISKDKSEPVWMQHLRIKAYEYFTRIPMPDFGPSLRALDFDEICFFAKAADKKGGYESWEKVPAYIKNTFDRLGIPEAEKKVLAGVGAQYESEVVYHSLEEELEKLGVLFLDMDVAVQKHPELVKKYFMKCVPANDHKFAALHGAVWSGGTFLYVPKGVKVKKPLQAYFRMNAMNMGQFEHTLIVIEEGAEAHYIEGCSAPKYGSNALHAGCVEVFVGKGAKFRYSSVENWSKDTYNLNTKRAIIEAGGIMEWVGGNMGSGVTMLYPCSILKGHNARADHLGIAFANAGQVQDTGAKIFHLGENTSSKITMKSISKGGGQSIYRGDLRIAKSAKNAMSHVECDALILDSTSISDTFPNIKVDCSSATVNHEARVGRLNEEDIFYLTSRGIDQAQAEAMIVNGFISPIVRELPLEYAVEMNRLIELEMENSIG
jgi:Fe-S cluster assembly protein SufB